ncbi:GspH/FimT family pseudopilin [Paludibacterium purpuratum]|uniref:Type II secretion system protein H n=1 Tax=Paludibacterium purpuratum TaxID=1144873 RepID=A0A4R7B9Q3_9NEIS|nr:GspH/FimT family pseudopilin [Paludibacterium purpuratum]TDR80732.1 prepilin-type N-terminal cleavage/methylation domain-containing protein [Paludibacterium purpuratum]
MERGFTLIEMLLVLSLMMLMMVSASSALGKLSGGVRMEASAWQLWSALGQARSEALYSGRPVQICGLWMRRNQRLLDCRQAVPGQIDRAADHWRQGVLLFADRPGMTHQQYDRDEDLRDYAVLPGIRLSASAVRYTVLADGRYAGGVAPNFVLRDPNGGACQSVSADAAGYRRLWCRGDHCPGCA